MKPIELIQQLIANGGAIVSSNACSAMEIAFARTEFRFAVDENGYGFVRRPQTWLEQQKEPLS